MDRLKAMEIFIRVIETGSFSSAGRQLRIGQPAVSKAVSQLEDVLGVRLLLRSTHGLTPTEAGQNFYTHAVSAVGQAEEAILAARGAGAALTGRLRVSAAVTFARLHIIPHLPEFLGLYPGLDIDIVLDDRNVDLIEAGIDIALRMGSLANSGLTARKLGQGSRVVLGTPSYFQRAGEPKTPRDLLNHQSVIYEQRGGGTAWTFRKGKEEIALITPGRVHINAAEGVRAAVFADLGLTVASEWMFAPELKSGEVRIVLEDWALPSIEISAIFPTGRQASAKARAFTTFIEERLLAAGTLQKEISP